MRYVRTVGWLVDWLGSLSSLVMNELNALPATRTTFGTLYYLMWLTVVILSLINQSPSQLSSLTPCNMQPLTQQIERQQDMKARMEAVQEPTTTQDKLGGLDPKSLESVLRDWNIAPEITKGGSKMLHYIVRDFILKWYNGFVSDDEDFPRGAAIVMIKAIGRFSNRCRELSTTEFKRLWIVDGIIKILSKKFNWFRTMRANAEEAHPEVFREFRALTPGERGTAKFFVKLEKVKRAVVEQYKKEKYLHHMCADVIYDDENGGPPTIDLTRQRAYFRRVVVKAMHVLLEPTELNCEAAFAVTREVMVCKVFSILPNVIGSKNLNGWTHSALKNMEKRRLQAEWEKKHGPGTFPGGANANANSAGAANSSADSSSSSSNNNNNNNALGDDRKLDDDGDDDDDDIDDVPELPPIISCLAPGDEELFFSAKLTAIVREAKLAAENKTSAVVNVSQAKTFKSAALGALEGESAGSFLLRILDQHYMSVSVVCGTGNSIGTSGGSDIQHFLVRAIDGQGFQVEEPAQSVVHATLLEMLASLNAPLLQLIREHRPVTDTIANAAGPDPDSGEGATKAPHVRFRLSMAQLMSLMGTVKRWKGGKSRIVHIPFQATLRDASVEAPADAEQALGVGAANNGGSSSSGSKVDGDGVESSSGANNTDAGSMMQDGSEVARDGAGAGLDNGQGAQDNGEVVVPRKNPAELLEKLKAHVNEALPLSFELSAEGGIDLNSTLGNALAASIHAILQDAVVVSVDSRTEDDSGELGLGLDEAAAAAAAGGGTGAAGGTGADGPDALLSRTVSYAALFDSGLYRYCTLAKSNSRQARRVIGTMLTDNLQK